jgi:hypothetical protein
LHYRPWALDFTPDDAGVSPFPFEEIINPYQEVADPNSPGNKIDAFIEWTTADGDPALRFWALPYDPQLTQWLLSVDPSRPSIMVAREFGGQPARWQFSRKQLLDIGWLEEEDVRWQPVRTTQNNTAWKAAKTAAWGRVRAEIEELQQLMQDDRERYLPEIDVQADGLADYFISFLGASEARYPWTIEYISCAMALGNIAYMFYKQQFKRARPSVLCPGLIPAFGPPEHPSFPSGHSFLGHLIALMLLEIPAIRQRYGLFTVFDGSPGGAINPNPPAIGGSTIPTNPLYGRDEIKSPMLWLSQRLAKNRERLGVHYFSDSTGSRHLAGAIWRALFHETDAAKQIDCPTLPGILAKAIAEWPTKLP